MIFFINFRNNYTMFGVTYAIPLITDRDYGEISRERACAIQEPHLMHLLSVVSVFIWALCPGIPAASVRVHWYRLRTA